MFLPAPARRSPKRKQRKPHYRGIIRSATTDRDGNRERWRKEILVPNLKALMDHYRIDHGADNKWYLLAVELASDHVRDFKPALKRGRKECEVSDEFDHSLFCAIEADRKKGLSISSAIRRVEKAYFGRVKFGAIRRRYYLLKDSRTPEAKRLRAYEHWQQKEMEEAAEEYAREKIVVT